MTPAEAAFVLSHLTASFNQHPFAADDPRQVVWLEELAPLDKGAALAAVRALRRSQDRLPSVAAFLTAYQAQRRREDGNRPPAPNRELPEASGPPLTQAEALARLREFRQRQREGRRGGDPAPVGESLP